MPGTYDIGGATEVMGATVSFTGSVANLGALQISSGTARFDTLSGTVTAPTVVLSGGVLNGSDTLTVSGSLTWTGGTLRGQVLVNGLDATNTPAAQLSAHLGLVFQEPERQLFNMTVADEVAFGLEGLAMPPAEIAARVTWALERVGLGDPDLLDRAPWQLSGGQQKRLAIATILALRPPILLLDEPMSGVTRTWS